MNGKYYAVVRRSDDDIKHWNYIKREKVNGKWRYYYDDSELRKFDQGASETTTNKYGNRVETNETVYKQTNDLFDKGDKTTGTSTSTTTTKYQGKLSRASAKAERWIYDTFLDGRTNAKRKRAVKRSISKMTGSIKSGANWLKSKLGIG